MSPSPDAPSPPLLFVIDDSLTVLRVMEAVLTQASYRVVCMESGRDVVEQARQTKPDLIMVDFAMPDISGYGVCQALGAQPDLESIPIVLMNTRGDPVGDRFIRELGIVDHITKPFAPAVLLAVVEHTLEKARGPKRPARLESVRPKQETDQPSSAPVPQQDAPVEAAAHALASFLGPTEAVPDLEGALRRALDDEKVSRLVRQWCLRTGPALVGELAIVPIAEVLQLLSLQRQSGFLVVRRDETSISIALLKGQVRLVTGVNLEPEFLLGNIFIQEKLMTPEELDRLLANRRGTQFRLGRQVVKLGYMDQEDLHRALERQSSELVYELLRWGRGEFHFTRLEELPPDVLEFEFDLALDQLLMEGFRRVDEWGLIESVIPSFDSVPVAIPGGLVHVGPGGLTPEEQAVFDAVDGQRTTSHIMQLAQSSSFDVARILYRLVSSRIVAMRPQPFADEPTVEEPPPAS